jgi:hypothetical protein
MRWLFVIGLGVACGHPTIPGPADGGGNVVDAGPPPIDYCDEIEPIVRLYCVATCHGQDMAYPGSPRNFRLDYYEPTDGGLPGIKAMAERIRVRVSETKDQPPADFPLQPTALDRRLVNEWVLAGAPRGDGGCEP